MEEWDCPQNLYLGITQMDIPIPPGPIISGALVTGVRPCEVNVLKQGLIKKYSSLEYITIHLSLVLPLALLSSCSIY